MCSRIAYVTRCGLNAMRYCAVCWQVSAISVPDTCGATHFLIGLIIWVTIISGRYLLVNTVNIDVVFKILCSLHRFIVTGSDDALNCRKNVAVIRNKMKTTLCCPLLIEFYNFPLWMVPPCHHSLSLFLSYVHRFNVISFPHQT